MVKRTFVLICMFVVSFFLLLVSVSPCSVSASESLESGGSSVSSNNRSVYTELTRSDIDTEKTAAEISSTWALDAFNNTLESAEDLFYYAVGSIGAIFSDETTLSGVKNQWNAIYANALEDPEVMRSIFYYGQDGQLYFTDEFIANTRNIVDQATFNQGIVSVPVCRDDGLIQRYLSIGALYLTNAITSAVSGDDLIVMPSPYYFDVYHDYWSIGFSVKDTYIIASFDTYSSYKSRFCNNTSADYCYPFRFFLSDFTEITSVPLDYYSDTPSSGSFSVMGSRTIASPFSICNWFTGVSASADNLYLLGCGSVEAYRTTDWLEFYLNGGTGVLRGNTYYKFDNAVDPDELVNGTAIYKQLQDDYKALAGEVAAGNKTLSEINDILSQEILDVANDIEQNTAVQANYLKKILAELKNISSKLTYSNVVGTVNAASNLLSLIGDALDDLFEASEGAFSLLDFVQDGLSDTMKSTFPFSLPHDMLLVFELLSVDPQTPEVKFHFDLASLGISYDYTYVADDFLKLAYLTRFFSSVGFVILLINLTNKMLKK